MTIRRTGLGLASALLLLSCGDSDSKSSTAPGAATVADEVDVRVAIPTADEAKFIDFVGSEVVVKPGEEKMFCVFKKYTGPDTAFFMQEAFQGKFGHHAVLLSAKDEKEDGFTEDCTDMKVLQNFEPFSIPRELPPGTGVFLPSGKRIAMQFHYVNTGKKPIRVRDVARLHKRNPADVKNWAAVWTTNSSEFKIEPRADGKRQFDCVLDRDTEILLIGGHMHEYGKSFKLEVGATEAELKPFYTVDEWKPDFRDNPPMQVFGTEPMKFPKGTIIRTTCEWKNSEDEALEFPKEMCTSFGYAAGFKYPFVCNNGKIDATSQ